jgi:branched-chain amino acid aminotransferase
MLTYCESIPDSAESGCFETMLGTRGRIPLIAHHFSRLQRSLDYLNWTKPYDLSPDAVLRIFLVLSSRNAEHHHWRIRLTVFKEDGITKWSIDTSIVPHPSQPFRLHQVTLVDVPNTVHEQLCKLSSREIYTVAHQKAVESGFDDALLVLQSGVVIETSIAGVLCFSKGNFYTPAVSSGGLRGVGLEILKPLLIYNQFSVITKELSIDFLCASEGLWIVNALRGPVQVTQVDGLSIAGVSERHSQVVSLYWDRIDELIDQGGV